MSAAVEATLGPHQHIGGGPRPPEPLGQATLLLLGVRIVGHNDQQIEIAVWSEITPRLRPEQVDPRRRVGGNQTVDNLDEGEHFGLGEMRQETPYLLVQLIRQNRYPPPELPQPAIPDAPASALFECWMLQETGRNGGFTTDNSRPLEMPLDDGQPSPGGIVELV